VPRSSRAIQRAPVQPKHGERHGHKPAHVHADNQVGRAWVGGGVEGGEEVEDVGRGEGVERDGGEVGQEGVESGGEADGREVGQVRAGAVEVVDVVACRHTTLEEGGYIVYEQGLDLL